MMYFKAIALLDKYATQTLGYTTSPKSFTREVLKNGFKLEQLRFEPMIKERN